MNRKFLVHRTVAPHLSELFNELYDALVLVNPNTDNFAVLIHNGGDEIQARVMPMSEKAMGELIGVSNNKIKYVAHVDEHGNFTKGEEK